MTTSAPDSAFTDDQFGHVYPEGYERHYWTRARGRVIRRHLGRLAPAGARVLEIGCGRGVAVAQLLRSGHDAWGVELGATQPIAAAAGRVHIGQDAFELDETFRASVSVILLLDVIEHIEDRGEFLARCRASFPALQGMLFTVPARMELWTNFDEFYGHHLRFDRPGLRTMLEEAGLTVTDLAYFFHSLYPPMWLLARSGRKREISFASPRFPALHGVLARVFALDSLVLPGWLPGASLIATCTVRSREDAAGS